MERQARERLDDLVNRLVGCRVETLKPLTNTVNATTAMRLIT